MSATPTRRAAALAFALAFAALLDARPVGGQGALDPAPPPGQRCVDLLHVADTRIIDDKKLVFFMKNGDAYLNELPYSCPALARDQAFLYPSAATSACGMDTITVLSRIGAGFLPGPICALGTFRTIERGEAERLLAPDP